MRRAVSGQRRSTGISMSSLSMSLFGSSRSTSTTTDDQHRFQSGGQSDKSTGRERGGRRGHGRRDTGRHERDPGCAGASGRHRPDDAGDAGAGLAGDPGTYGAVTRQESLAASFGLWSGQRVAFFVNLPGGATARCAWMRHGACGGLAGISDIFNPARLWARRGHHATTYVMPAARVASA
jgi:hypothetical protein